MPSNTLLGGIGRVSNSDISVLIILLTYFPSYKSLTLPNVYLFLPAVLIIYIYIALNACRLITYIVRVLSLF